MLIKGIHIDRFGKLKDKKLTFGEDLNIIYGMNEAGKSTIQNFMLSSFYGARTTKKNGMENVRKKYIPFNKDYTFGTMEIEQDGEVIVIERKIAKTKKDDLFRAYEKETYEQVNVSENLGKELFQLEYEEFIKTLYINQGGGRFLSEKDEGLATRLTNLLETGDEEISYTKAIDKVNLEIKSIKGLRKNGRLEDLYAELATLYAELGESRRIEAQRKELEEKLASLTIQKKESDRLKKELHNLKDKIHLFNVKDEFLRIRKNLEELEHLKSERIISFKPISDLELKALRQSEKDIQNFKEDIQEINEKLENFGRDALHLGLLLEDYDGFQDLSREEILKMVSLQGEELLLEEKLKHFAPKNTMNENLFVRRQELKKILQRYEMHLNKLKSRDFSKTIVPALIIVSGILYYVLKKNFINSLLLIFSSIPLYLILSAFEKSRIRWHLKKSDEYEDRILNLSRELGMDYGELLRSKQLIERIPDDDERLKLQSKYEQIKKYKESIFNKTQASNLEELINKESEYRRILERNEELLREIKRTDELLKEKHETLQKKIADFEKHLEPTGFDKLKDDITTYLEYYESQALRMKDLSIREEALKYSLKSIIGERDEEEIRQELETLSELGITEGIDFKELEEKERSINEKELQTLDETNEIMLKLSSLRNLESLFIEDTILLLKNEEMELLRRYDVLCLTRDLMKESYDKLRHDYSKELNEKVTEIYSEITSLDRTIKVNELFGLNYSEGGVLFSEDFLSTGSLEQLYLSLRLAMAEIMFPKMKVPFFLDEPFVSYDKIRLGKILDYLVSKKDRYQLFIFTCQEREMEIIKEDATVISLT
ncbi:MAG: AAA family ATPase [Clostridiaceae bacterium]